MKPKRPKGKGKSGPLDEYLKPQTEEKLSIADEPKNYLDLALLEEENRLQREFENAIVVSLEIRELLREVIPKLAESDPTELLEGYIRSLADMYNEILAERRAVVAARRQEELQSKEKYIIEELKRVPMIYGIPVKWGSCSRGNFGIYPLCIDNNGVAVDGERLRYVIEKRIVPCPDGRRRFICVSQEREVSPRDVVAGIDTSVREVVISPPESHLPAYRFRIAFAVAYIRAEGLENPVQIWPRPENVQNYFTDENLRYMVFDDVALSRYSDRYYERRVFECAQNIVQYSIADDLAWGRTAAASPGVILFDGRIYPYEYKFSELLEQHGEYVAEALKAYSRVVELVRGNTVVVGVVKRTLNLPLLWRLVKYAIYAFGYYDRGILVGEVYDRAAGGLVWDGALSYSVFRLALRELSVEGTIISTFGLERPFWVLDDQMARFANRYAKNANMSWREFYDNERSSYLWRDVLRTVRYEEGVELGEEAREKLEMFEKTYKDSQALFDRFYPLALSSSVLMFFGIETELIKKGLTYGAGTEGKTLILPRYEVLLPGTDAERYYRRPTIWWQAPSAKNYVPYPGEELGPGSLYGNKILILPSVVARAHSIAKTSLKSHVEPAVSAMIKRLYYAAYKRVLGGRGRGHTAVYGR